MILGIYRHIHAKAFEEINTAVEALVPWEASWPVANVVFNAHAFPHRVQADDIIFNLENVGIQLDRGAFPDNAIWDFSKRNCYMWGDRAKHVPVGYHQSMERFDKVTQSECKWDVAFTGSPSERRNYIIDELKKTGLRVLQVPSGVYGASRDSLLAQSRMALNPLYYECGLHPVLRSAHCTANRLPVLAEDSEEMPDWVLLHATYGELINKTIDLLNRRREYLDHMAEAAYIAFRMNPLRLPL